MDGSDYTQSKARTYHFDLQQNILPNLDLDIGFFRQELHDLEDGSEQPAQQRHPRSNALYIDTNAYLMNGAPNAYAGSTFIEDYQGDGFHAAGVQPELARDADVQPGPAGQGPALAELPGPPPVHGRSLDPRRRAAGRPLPHRHRRRRRLLPVGTVSAEQHARDPGQLQYRQRRRRRDPLAVHERPGSYAATIGPALRGIPGFGTPHEHHATHLQLQHGPVGDQRAAPRRAFAFNGYEPTENVQDQKTYYWQSFFWNDRIVGSFGLNDDIVKNRSDATIYNATINGVSTATSNNPGLVTYVNGIENPALKYDMGPWNPTTVNGVYQPGTSQLAQTSLGEIGGNTYSEGFVIKPFENWAGIDEAANNGNVLAGVIRTLGFTFNKADNFNPPAGTFTDLFGNPLGKPAGTEKDYGLEVATPDKKLYLRMTWFKSSNQNNVTGVSQTLTDRELYVDQNEVKNWATTDRGAELRRGSDPDHVWQPDDLPPEHRPAAAGRRAHGPELQLPLSGAGGALDRRLLQCRGHEYDHRGGYDVELTYNPLPNWTMKITGGRQDAQLSAVDTQAKAYQAVRMPQWLAMSTTAYPNVFTNWAGGGVDGLHLHRQFLEFLRLRRQHQRQRRQRRADDRRQLFPERGRHPDRGRGGGPGHRRAGGDPVYVQLSDELHVHRRAAQGPGRRRRSAVDVLHARGLLRQHAASP